MTPGLQTADRRLGRREFTVLMSVTMAAVALSIDMMLPAFPAMREDFGLPPDSNTVALVVTAFFVGLGIGQPVWGPLSDALGRKRVLWVGLAVYGLSVLGAVLAPSLAVLLVLRVVSGVGAASLRVVAMGVIRDTFAGVQMAKTLSTIMAIFILVPIVAPTLGAGILLLGFSWHGVFVFLAVFAAALGGWLTRLPETLPPERRMSLRWTSLANALRTVVGNRFVMGLTAAQTATFGFFTSYLASSQLIVADVLGLEPWFPVIFAAAAAVLGVGMLTNPRLLDRWGLRAVLRRGVLGYAVAMATFTAVTLAFGGRPPLVLYLVTLAPILFAQAVVIPNLNSAAMTPVGRVAGTAAAVIGSFATLGGAFLGALIDRTYDGTLAPLATAGLLAAVVVLVSWRWADRVWNRAMLAEEDRASPGRRSP